jgi:hypothetical protein
VLENRTLPSVMFVMNTHDSGLGSLRDEIAKAQDGDTIRFATILTGKTITLTSGEILFDIGLDIEGLGAGKLAISGNFASRIFNIDRDASTVTIAGLTLENGKASVGGAIRDEGASLVLRSDRFKGNQAIGNSSFAASGGALYVLGETTSGMSVTISNCQFTFNMANGAATTVLSSSTQSAQPGDGGAIYLDAGVSAGLTLTVNGCTFMIDFATGGAGANGVPSGSIKGSAGAPGQGGAVYIDAEAAAQPLFSFSTDRFNGCSATGGTGGNGISGALGSAGAGGQGGEADGGAFYYTASFAASPILSVGSCTFVSNSAVGGNGGMAAAGGSATSAAPLGNNGGNGGSGLGGALFADFKDSAAAADNFTADNFNFNRAVGANGGNGGANDAAGTAGNGGAGGAAEGGGLYVTISDLAAATQLTIAQSAITFNVSHGGNGGSGGDATSGNGGDGAGSLGATGGGLFLFSDAGPGSEGIGAADTWTLRGDSIAFNACYAGNGGDGGNALSGGDGGSSGLVFGGGVDDEFLGHLEILHSTIIYNGAVHGQPGSGGSGSMAGSPGFAFPSVGGGIAIGLGTACASADSVILRNHADMNADVFGTLGTC